MEGPVLIAFLSALKLCFKVVVLYRVRIGYRGKMIGIWYITLPNLDMFTFTPISVICIIT